MDEAGGKGGAGIAKANGSKSKENKRAIRKQNQKSTTSEMGS